MTTRKPFFPRDKPKSWVVAISAGLIGLLVAGPLLFLGKLMAWGWLFKPAAALFVLCLLTFLAMWLVGVAGMLTGKYQGITEKSWHEQVW